MVNRIIKLFLTILIFAVCSKKEEEPQVLEVVNISNTPGRSEHPAIAADSRGYFYVVWDDQTPDGKTAVYITQRPPGGNWTTPNYIINPQRMMRQPDIAVDKENTIHVVGQYTNPQGWFEIFYTKKPLGGDWSELEIIGMYGMACHPKIAVDNNGDVHIVWQELVGYWPVIYAKRTKDGSWSTPVEISKDAGGENYTLAPKIVIDQSGNDHVVWTQSIANSSDVEDVLMYVTNSPSGTWVEPKALCHDTYLLIGLSPQIVIDDRENISVVFTMQTEGVAYSDIFYIFKQLGGKWNTPVRVCSTTTASQWPHIVVDFDEQFHLCWIEHENKIYYTLKAQDNNWQEPKIYTISGTTGSFVQMAIVQNVIGLIFNGCALPSPGDDNYEIFFGEIPKR